MKNQGDVTHEQREGGNLASRASKFTAHDLLSEYTLFNHGVLFGPAGLRDPEEDPLIEWYNRLGDPSEHILRQAVESPILRGLDAPAIEGRGLTWNNIFCGVHNHLWQSLLSFMCSSALTNHKQDQLYLVTAQTVLVPDPVIVDRGIILAANMPSVPITIFGLDGSRDRYQLGVTDCPGFPGMYKLPPRPETVKLWQQIKSGDLSGLAERTTADMEAFVREYTQLRDKVMREGPDRDYRRIIGVD